MPNCILIATAVIQSLNKMQGRPQSMIDVLVQEAVRSEGAGNARTERKPHHSAHGRWTKDEHAAFVQGKIFHRILIAVQKHGKAWGRVQAEVRTRTTAQIRTHAQKFFLKVTRDVPSGVDIIAFIKSKPLEYFVEMSDSDSSASAEKREGPTVPARKRPAPSVIHRKRGRPKNRVEEVEDEKSYEKSEEEEKVAKGESEEAKDAPVPSGAGGNPAAAAAAEEYHSRLLIYIISVVRGRRCLFSRRRTR